MAATATGAAAEKKMSEATALSSCTAQRADARKITIRLVDVNEHIVCKLCSGYFRDALTIKECAHTFCSSCIRNQLRRNWRNPECPTCHAHLGAKPLNTLVADPHIQGLVDMLLPDLKEKEEVEEREFYKHHGFKRKPGGEETGNSGSGTAKRRRPGSDTAAKPSSNYTTPVQSTEKIAFELVPQTSEVLPLFLRLRKIKKQRFMRTEASSRIYQLRKYVALSLGLPNADHVEICCRGAPLGGEYSLTFVNRTIWCDPKKKMVLEYYRKLV